MRICYINFSVNNPRDQITLRGLRMNGIAVTEVSCGAPGLGKYARIAREYRAQQGSCDMVMVGYAGAALVIFMRLLTRKKIFYNALSSFYDSMVVSRLGSAFSVKAVWYCLIDFLAFHLADRVFLECEAQKELVMRRFNVTPRKLSVQFVGADDRMFHPDPAVPKRARFTAVFRGMFLPEAGADVVVRAAKELEGRGIDVRIIGRGLLLPQIKALVAELAPANLELISAKLSDDELRRAMLECHLSLGQLADHPRVHTTIPHKAFESMAMGLPYLTGANRGVLEILEGGATCFVVPPGDHRALARAILGLRDRPEELERVAENARQLYLRRFTPDALARNMIASFP